MGFFVYYLYCFFRVESWKRARVLHNFKIGINFMNLYFNVILTLPLISSLISSLFYFYFLISNRSKWKKQAAKWNVEYWKGQSGATLTCHQIYYISKSALILMTKILSGTKQSWKLNILHDNDWKEIIPTHSSMHCLKTMIKFIEFSTPIKKLMIPL